MAETKCGEEIHTVSSSGADDDDVDLGGDEGTKELDGNIDEDELLKDTEVDDSNKSLVEKQLPGSNLDTNPGVLSVKADTIPDDKAEQSNNRVKLDFQTLQENTDVNETTEKKATTQDNLTSNLHTSNKGKVKLGDKTELSINTETDHSHSRKEVSDEDLTVEKCSEDKGNSSGNDPELSKVTGIVSEELSNTKSPIVLSSTKISCSKLEERKNDSSDKVSTDFDKVVDKNEEEANPAEEKEIVGENENSKDSTSVYDKHNNQEDCDERTKFLHVDEDNSRPDESLEPIDTGEDPFALTVDEPITSDKSFEKNDEIQKELAQNEDRPSKEAMDIDDTISNSDKDKEENECSSREVAPVIDKEHVSSDGSIDSQSQINNIMATKDGSSPLQNNKKLNQTESSNLTECGKEPNSLDNSDLGVHQNKNTPTNIENKDVNTLTVAKKTNDSPNVSLDKGVKTPAKTKHKSKKQISDESSEESDLEVIPKSSERPKRDAAKKAESQIKVSIFVLNELPTISRLPGHHLSRQLPPTAVFFFFCSSPKPFWSPFAVIHPNGKEITKTLFDSTFNKSVSTN